MTAAELTTTTELLARADRSLELAAADIQRAIDSMVTATPVDAWCLQRLAKQLGDFHQVFAQFNTMRRCSARQEPTR